MFLKLAMIKNELGDLMYGCLAEYTPGSMKTCLSKCPECFGPSGFSSFVTLPDQLMPLLRLLRQFLLVASSAHQYLLPENHVVLQPVEQKTHVLETRTFFLIEHIYSKLSLDYCTSNH